MTSGRILSCLVASVVAVAALAQARAAPLDDDACARAKSEHEQLKTAGVDRDMAKGPAWAVANLAPARLDQVRRFIELEELLVFRCRDKTLVTLPSKEELAARSRKSRRDKRKPAARKTRAPDRTKARVPSQWGVTVTRSPTEPEAGDADTPGDPAFNPFAKQLGLPPN